MNRGFSLVEMLVALVVLSVGLLGAAGLLLGGLRDQSLALRHGAASSRSFRKPDGGVMTSLAGA